MHGFLRHASRTGYSGAVPARRAPSIELPMTPARLKVLHILHSLNAGGMEGRVARLAHGMDPSRIEIQILTFRKPAARQVELPAHVKHCRMEIPPGIHPDKLWALRTFIRRERFDIVHTHNWGSMFYGVLAARLAGVPYIVHGEHGLDAETNPITWKRILGQRWLSSLLARVVSVNAFIGKEVERTWHFERSKIVVLPNGVDLRRFRPVDPPLIFTFGTVARFDTVKNLPCLLEGYRRFRAATPEVGARLVLVGDGPLFQTTKDLALTLGLGAEVEFPGGTPSPEAWYGRFSVYLNTSYYEGMSNTILEAMASGRPVIASDVDGNRDWLTPANAWFFRSGDPDDLAEKMLLSFRDGEARARMAEANRARAEVEFDNADFIRKYQDVYFSLSSRPGPGG
jgi:glycosyltransferase involved in cell wall biosynthesis